jgi:GAF domain-containing protein
MSDQPKVEPVSSADLTASIAETVRTLFSAGSVSDALDQLVHLAVSTIEGCDYAGIFMAPAGEVFTPFCTDPLVAVVDGMQRSTGEGPCLDALSQGVAFYAADLAQDSRWAVFGPAAAVKGIRSLFAVPLLVNGAPGALNLYAAYPDAFGVIDRGRGLLLGAMAGLAFSAAQTHEDEERRTASLHAALASREVIGQAQGILMERERVSSDQAFDILRRASQHLNVKLRDIAQNLVDTGERPDTGKL